VAHARDFRCLTKGQQPAGKHFYVFNHSRRKLKKAVAMSESGDLGPKGYPVGTILQLVPFEAMVKRGGKFNSDGHGWEFFRLDTSSGKTKIVQRGGAEVISMLSHGSCQTCHVNLAAAHDLVCEFVVGTSGIGLTDGLLDVLQKNDPRCK
jgi:hypothetical protein